MKKFNQQVCVLQVEGNGRFLPEVYLVYDGVDRGAILPNCHSLFEAVYTCLQRHCNNEIPRLAAMATENNTSDWDADDTPIEKAADMVATALETDKCIITSTYAIGNVTLWLSIPDNE